MSKGERQGTHWADCWKAHPGCAKILEEVLWSQYLSDGTDETLKKYEEVKFFRRMEGGISL
jgi:predicted naringenin-chalcone synthase